MLVTVAIVGALVLFALAAVAGLLDARSQQSGWSRIAAARRAIFDDKQVIAEWTLSLEEREEQLAVRERWVARREDAVALRESRLDGDDGPQPPGRSDAA